MTERFVVTTGRYNRHVQEHQVIPVKVSSQMEFTLRTLPRCHGVMGCQALQSRFQKPPYTWNHQTAYCHLSGMGTLKSSVAVCFAGQGKSSRC